MAVATRRLWEWLIFEEEYYRAGAPQRVTQNGIFLLAPTSSSSARSSRRTRSSRRWRRANRRGARAGRNRTRAAISPASRARRVRDDVVRWLASLGSEDLDDARRVLHTSLRPVPQRPRRRAPPGADLLPRRLVPPRHHGARGRTARRRRRLRRGVPRRRVRARHRRARRTRRRVGGRDGHDRFGARPHAAVAGTFPRDRTAVDRPLPRDAAATRRCAIGSPPRTSTPRRIGGRRSGR